MASSKNVSERAARRDAKKDAKKALAEAGRAAKEAKKLRKGLKDAGRTRFQTAEAAALADLERARADIDLRPGRAARTARAATARLERASIRATSSGGARRRDLAKSAREAKDDKDAKSRAKTAKKTIKRRRAQSKMANKMAKKLALRNIVTSVVTPTDAESREKDVKMLRRLAKRPS
jgi:hypothetical protein